ncbi:preprotein translocase subunit YajC [Gryllotalpicola sp.]|uniref:preprotein translocase subunit YajC n=1 Tax=Gryllotalpicola sp. TaxID=1932787 RepID=UPI00262FAD77|nr:preprotein translocase subunit YajC [Gryllotalpicola sp.]
MGLALLSHLLLDTPSPTSTPTTAGSSSVPWLNYVMIAVIIVIVLFMWRNSRRRRNQVAEQQSQFLPGAEVMTNFGLFGTIRSIDEETNKVVLETGPGTTVTVHRQVITRLVEQPAANEHHEELPPTETPEGQPLYGERIEDEPKTDTK